MSEQEIEICCVCGEPSEIGTHSIERGEIVSRHYCAACYNRQ